MPGLDIHAATVARNRDLLNHLVANRLRENPEWVAIVAFYTGLHVVEAVFAFVGEGGIRHTTDHYTRHNVLRSTNRYSKLWQHYQHLVTVAHSARYLDDGLDSDRALPDPDDVLNVFINHHLAQLLAAAERLLGRPLS